MPRKLRIFSALFLFAVFRLDINAFFLDRKICFGGCAIGELNTNSAFANIYILRIRDILFINISIVSTSAGNSYNCGLNRITRKSGRAGQLNITSSRQSIRKCGGSNKSQYCNFFHHKPLSF